MDMVLLKGLAKRFPSGAYFEIGTWRGESVANIASAGIHCTTFNLSDEQMRERNISDKIIRCTDFIQKKIPPSAMCRRLTAPSILIPSAKNLI
jgi:hypothetical protein